MESYSRQSQERAALHECLKKLVYMSDFNSILSNDVRFVEKKILESNLKLSQEQRCVIFRKNQAKLNS